MSANARRLIKKDKKPKFEPEQCQCATPCDMDDDTCCNNRKGLTQRQYDEGMAAGDYSHYGSPCTYCPETDCSDCLE